MILRKYQQESVDAAIKWFCQGKDKPLIVLPTGTGKSVVCAELCRDIVQDAPHARVLVVTHVKELVRQNYEKMLAVWPDAPIGIYSAGLGKREASAQILFCGIQSVHRRAHEIGHVDVMIIDEAHTISRRGEGMWHNFESELRKINPKMVMLGLTATPFRLDSGSLYLGDAAQFNGVCYDYSVVDAINDGYLSEIVPAPVETHLKTHGVKKRGGEFIAGELERAIDTDEQTRSCCEEIIQLGKDRKSWLIFAAGNQHATHIHEYLQSRGYKGHVLTQSTKKKNRDQIISTFLDGQCRYIVNNMILTTGFDCPHLDLIACMRPTQSQGLWVQICGRGMRLSPGKNDCLLLDFGRNIERHGPIDKIKGRVYEEKEGGEAPIKVCDKCRELCHAAAAICPACGHEFPVNEVSLDKKASSDPVFSFQNKKEVTVNVLDMKVSRHKSKDPFKPDTMRVKYSSLTASVNEFICYDHPADSYAYQKAVKWGGPCDSIEAALKKDWTVPSKLIIVKDGKYWKVIKRIFGEENES